MISFLNIKIQTLRAILSGVDWYRGVEEEAFEVDFLIARIHDEVLDLNMPENFVAKRL